MRPVATVGMAATALLAVGCTFEPGGPFATVEATLETAYERPADRALGATPAQRLASDYAITLTRAEAEIVAVRVLGVEGDGPAPSFDPTSPPPGFGPCHNGHCHSPDGRLVPYDEVAAAAGGAPASARPLLEWPLGRVDLLAPTARALACAMACTLPRARLRRAEIAVRTLVFEGTVEDLLEPRRIERRSFRWAPKPAAAGAPVVTLGAPLAIATGREEPARVRLGLSLAPGPSLFDPIDWSRLPAGEPIDLDAALPPDELRALRARMDEIPVRASIGRE